MEILVDKAWELCQHTKRFSIETILKATLWLEERHRTTPCAKIAMAIALHYLILAMRQTGGIESDSAQEYCARAVRWQTVARQSVAGALASKAADES
jgi:hypothetical protein